MKIISWNCNGKFREKYKDIIKLNADIYVVEECEEPEKYGYAEFADNYLWVGEKPAKGVGLFANKGVSIKNNNWPNYHMRNFLSVNINGDFDLLCVWACKPYIEEYCIYQAVHREKYSADMVIIGDFNSNKIWDKEHGSRSHSVVVEELKDIGLVSAYHYVTGEEQGCESKNTFYLYRHKDKGYHIDYCFANPENIKKFQILSGEYWIKYSDHIPIMIETFDKKDSHF